MNYYISIKWSVYSLKNNNKKKEIIAFPFKKKKKVYLPLFNVKFQSPDFILVAAWQQ